LQQGEKIGISEITNQFVEINAAETATPDSKNVETYRALQEIQDDTSLAMRNIFEKQRRFISRS
jgi:hypothetical protein